MPLDPQRIKALFLAALDLPDPTDRTAFLDRECEDNELRQRLDELLAAHDQPASELERPIAASTEAMGPPSDDPDLTPVVADRTTNFPPPNPPPASLIDSVIAGRYKIRQEIGEGGMGSVYLAEQLQPVKRQVALKLIKAGMDTRTVLARFDSERQALAVMDHPNIAKVLDAGSTDSGHPFFVMELVKGIPLTEYCDQHRLGVPERLDLFRQICSAVQHAHQKGIIHRDLKPTNILVESHDDKPVPKVIDFGLAKATSGVHLTEQSLFTGFGGVAGTPLYMAPEQASFNAVDIDTRADIYALGVILYELLAGSTPIQRDTLHRVALDEMLRVIREVEPPTPSSRISSSDALPNIAATRQTEPARLSRYVRGDLDWIVMKALAKERQRRYDSPIAFSDDIERFLNHEPVSAGPPTAMYRFRKFVRRHRGQVIAASLVLLALVLGIVGTTLGLIEAKEQRGKAVAEAREKEKAWQAEAAQRRQVEKSLVRVHTANDILGSVFKDLSPLAVEKGRKPLSALLGEHLDRATAEIEGEAIGDPLTVARMQMTLGQSQFGLGYFAKAIDLFTKARATFTARLGPDDPLTLKSMNNLAHVYQELGQLDRAEPLFEETLAQRKVKLGPDHPDTVLGMSHLAEVYRAAGRLDRALPLFEEALPLMKAKLGTDHAETLGSMNNLALGYQNAGRLDRALRLFEEAVPLMKAKLGTDHPDTLSTMGNLALCYEKAGRLDRVLPLLEEVLALKKAALGPDHPHTLAGMIQLANAYRKAGQLDRALLLQEATLPLCKAKLGPDHPDTITSINDLASSYQTAGRFDRALPLFEEAVALCKAKLGRDHPHTNAILSNLAGCYRKAGRFDRALPLQREVFEFCKAKFGPDHPNTLVTMNNLAEGYRAVGQLDRAVPLHEEALARYKANLGPDHPGTLGSLNNLALSYSNAGQPDRGVPLFEEALALRKVKFGPDHPDTLTSMSNLATAYGLAGQPDRAVPLLREMVAIQKKKAGADSPQAAVALAALGINLLEQKAWGDAEPFLREALAIREVKEPEAWSTFNNKSQLGGALLGQKKYAEAEPLLRAGYEGMDRRADKIPRASKDRLVLALDRLIELAEATGKPDEAKAWGDEKARLSASPPDDKKP